MKKNAKIENLYPTKMINPQQFWEYLDNENDRTSFIAASITYELKCNPREQWNKIGREIIEDYKLEILSEKIYKYIQEKQCESFLTRFYSEKMCWNPDKGRISKYFRKGKTANTLREKSLKYLKENSLINHCGSILLENRFELRHFLDHLIAFSTIFNYQEIFIFCLDFPLILELSGHSDVIMYVSSKDIFADIKEFSYKNGLTLTSEGKVFLPCPQSKITKVKDKNQEV